MNGGRLEIWAAASIHALGAINFLFDKSFEPYITIDELNDYFGTTKSTVSNKAREIREMLKIGHFSPDFSTRRSLDSNPFNNMVLVDGFIVSLSQLSDDLQELVRQQRAMGGDIEFYTSK